MGTGSSVFAPSAVESASSPGEETFFTFPSATAYPAAEQQAENVPLISPAQPLEIGESGAATAESPKVAILVQKPSDLALKKWRQVEKEEDAGSSPSEESSTSSLLSPSGIVRPSRPRSPILTESPTSPLLSPPGSGGSLRPRRKRSLFKSAMTTLKRIALSPTRPKRKGSRSRSVKQPSEHKAVVVVRRVKDRAGSLYVAFQQVNAIIPAIAELVQFDEPVTSYRQRLPSPVRKASDTILSDVPDKLTREELGYYVEGKLKPYATSLGCPPENISLFTRNAQLWVRVLYARTT